MKDPKTAGLPIELLSKQYPNDEESCIMSTYICLGQWTQKGIENVRESPARLDAAREEWEKDGATIRDFFMTTGQYDLVFVVEAPDDATLAKVLLAQASKGGLRTTTLHAFSEAEYRAIIGSL